MMETRTYQGYTYQRANTGDQWTLVGPSAGQIISDPYAAHDEARKDQSQVLDQARYSLSAQQNERANATQPFDVRKAAADAVSAENKSENSGGDRAFDRAKNLRNDYLSLPSVKNYTQALPVYAAGLRSQPGPAGDQDLIYAYAKVMDPNSVVREGEQASVANADSWFQATSAKLKNQLDRSGRFTPQYRKELREEMANRMGQLNQAFIADRVNFKQNAVRNGVDPLDVVGEHPGGRFQNLTREVLGREPMQLDFNGQAVAGPTSGEEPGNGLISTGPTKTDRNTAREKALDALLRSGADNDTINATSTAMGGMSIDSTKLDQMRDAVKRGYKGQTFDTSQEVPTTAFNRFVGSDMGAGIASALNAGGVGIPSLLAPQQMSDLRDAHPLSSFAGDIAGGVVGTGLAGGLLRNAAERVGSGTVASILANPLTADVAYGAGYGATQADNPLYGAGAGIAGALVGNRLGAAVSRSLPSAVGKGAEIAALDETVPTSQQLRGIASDLYTKAENAGLTATPDETLALADTTGGILSKEGRLSPTGRLTEVQPKVKEAYGLIQDYADQPMTPTQVQTVRKVISDARASKDGDERRIAKMLLTNFDEWTDATNPDLASGLSEARGVASRYLQGDRIAEARDLANVRAGQFSNSGKGNALRTDFRQLDRSIAKGDESFAPGVERAVADVARGTSTGNVFRNIGRFAPTGPVSALPMLALAGGGTSAAGPAGGIAALLLGAGALGARQVGQHITDRSAQVAQNIAFAGPAYEAALNQILDDAAVRGGHVGTAGGTEVARALLSYSGY